MILYAQAHLRTLGRARRFSPTLITRTIGAKQGGKERGTYSYTYNTVNRAAALTLTSD